MRQYAIALTPQNYELFFAYAEGSIPALSREIDGAIAAGAGLTPDMLRAWHELHFGSYRQLQQISESEDALSRELRDLLSVLRSSGDKAGDYAKHLQSTSARLDSGLDGKALRDIVSGLAAATIDMAEHNRTLTARLQQSSAEMEHLRRTLNKVRDEAMTDPLTGLANRKQLSIALQSAIARALDENQPLCFVMCDIDFFKKFNDTWGHQTGDQIIRFVATTIQRKAEPSLCARYGGEEFSIVLTAFPIERAFALCDEIRASIENKKLFRKSTNEELGKITISGGIAQWRPGESMESLIERADACLYASKRNGRNQITTDRMLASRAA